MPEIKIDKKVPMPPLRARATYPFRDMKPGDSFFVENGNNASISCCASNFASKNPGFKFTTRREGNGYRCWRIA